MRPATRAMLSFLVGRAAFGLTFLLCAVGRWPTYWYLPLEHRWVFAASVRTVGMDWYGRSALAIAVGLAAGALTWGAGGTSLGVKMERPAVTRWVAHLGATMLFFDVAFYTLTLMTREVDPIPLPAWYVPR
ncbi:MAG: hypothetical protein U0325_31235 [Polyangiales bacterium]